MQITPALVKYRLRGLKSGQSGTVSAANRIMAKISRSEVAEQFLNPAPEQIVRILLDRGEVTREQANLSKKIAMADGLMVEADSGGHTDGGVAYALMPAMIRLRNRKMKEYRYSRQVFIGSAGGIGTPEAAAAAFMLGADYILTGSINQCTIRFYRKMSRRGRHDLFLKKTDGDMLLPGERYGISSADTCETIRLRYSLLTKKAGNPHWRISQHVRPSDSTCRIRRIWRFMP